MKMDNACFFIVMQMILFFAVDVVVFFFFLSMNRTKPPLTDEHTGETTNQKNETLKKNQIK